MSSTFFSHIRLLALLFLPVVVSPNVYSQGFPTTATNWTLPGGGDINKGFYMPGGAGKAATGSQDWSTFDINGDGKPDMVVTAEYANGYTDNDLCFGVGANPYWKV